MRILLKAALFAGLIAIAAPSFAQIHLSINFGPPEPRQEVMVESPYPDGVWVAGYYAYNSGRSNYDWTPGRWERPPSPYHVWSAPRYVRRGDHMDYYRGQWKDKGKHGGSDNGRGNSKHDNGNHNGQGNHGHGNKGGE